VRFDLPPLPHPKHALEPHMGRETLEQRRKAIDDREV
jgi:hypothetical protein